MKSNNENERDAGGNEPRGDGAVIAATRHWLDAAVIGLNLCPFAHAPRAANRIRFAVSAAHTQTALADDLVTELQLLSGADADDIETTLLIHPGVLGDFLDYNDFLDVTEDILERMDLVGELQVASFHPQYQFTGTEPEDMGNYTNRSPYPMLHLLREDSIERAVASFPDTDRIYLRNIEVLRALGHEGWRRLEIGAAKGD